MPDTVEQTRTWSLGDVHLLRELLEARVPADVIAMKMKRGELDVRRKAMDIGRGMSPDDATATRKSN
jgi:hypothetical protein